MRFLVSATPWLENSSNAPTKKRSIWRYGRSNISLLNAHLGPFFTSRTQSVDLLVWSNSKTTLSPFTLYSYTHTDTLIDPSNTFSKTIHSAKQYPSYTSVLSTERIIQEQITTNKLHGLEACPPPPSQKNGLLLVNPGKKIGSYFSIIYTSPVL